MISAFRTLLLAIFVLQACRGGSSGSVSTETAPSGPRLTAFISDLHLGVGRDSNGQFFPYEDFRWKDEFLLFLKALDVRGSSRVELVLNGDTFELWQSVTDECRYFDASNKIQRDLGCTEDDALKRLERVLTSHSDELRALGVFANTGENRVVLVPGNHDAAILFPAVAARVIDRIGAKERRVNVAFDGYWLSHDGQIYAEHGHQIGNEVNLFENWPKPFVQKNGRKHLVRPWGEQFVQEYYNDWEKSYPIIDNLADEGQGLRYGIAAKGWTATATASPALLKFLLLQVSWAQFGQSLGSDSKKNPQWDLDKIRLQGRAFVLESVAKDDPARQAILQVSGTLPVEFSDDEIIAICDKRAAQLKSQLRLKQKQTITECPRLQGSLGAGAEYLFGSRDVAFTRRLEKIDETLSREGKRDTRFKLFIYSHTHRADRGFYPSRLYRPEWNPLVMNTGAWQRVITKEMFDELKGKRKLTDAEVLQKLRVEDLPPCYTVILVAPYTDQPNPSLEYWAKNRESRWSFADSCEFQN
jgi:UDP-2,3-diacylglucosamine pyrophosphatase LpxH